MKSILFWKKISPVTKISEIGPQDSVSYKKPVLLDAPTDRQTKLDLNKLLNVNKDAFAEDEIQIGITPIIQMSVDTGDHPPIAKKLYTLALKYYDWVKEEIELLEAGVIRERHSSWSAPIIVVPKMVVARDFV